MGHRDRRRPVEARQQRFQPLDALDVEMVGRLVQQQQVGAARQLAGERDPLFPAARQRPDRCLGGTALPPRPVSDSRASTSSAAPSAAPSSTAARTVTSDANRGTCSSRATRSPRWRETAPRSVQRRPARTRNSVDFPAPFGPMSPMRSPSETVKLTPSNRGRAPNEALKSCAVSRIAKLSPAVRA